MSITVSGKCTFNILTIGILDGQNRNERAVQIREMNVLLLVIGELEGYSLSGGGDTGDTLSAADFFMSADAL